MLNLLQKAENAYAKLWLSISGYDRWMKVKDDVQFEKPWFNLVLHYKWYLVPQFTIICLVRTLISFSPLIIGYIIELRSVNLLFYFVFACVFIIATSYWTDYLVNAGQVSMAHSIIQSANKRFLSVDPIFHTMRKSGMIMNKVNRGAVSIESLIDITMYNFVPIFVAYTSMTIAFAQYSGNLAGLALFFVVGLLTIQSSLKIFETRSFEPVIIESGDSTSNVQYENMQQTSYIRTLFASGLRFEELKKRSDYEAHTVATKYMIGAVHFDTMYIMYFICFGTLGYLVLQQVIMGNISSAIGVSLLVTYILNTRDITTFGDVLRNFSRNIMYLNDLFNFLAQYGQQKFPVLEKSNLSQTLLKKKILEVNLLIEDLHFQYPDGIKVFSGHWLNHCLRFQNNFSSGLYGVIGPSGSGKSTLINIIGGQLKPDSGKIKINEIDIYSINEEERQHLIAMQPQISTALRGSLKYNILFGLPANYKISDEILLNTLRRVGLWNLFAQYQGLETMVGEGGVNLSGGQRQRLNFANLYMRATYFRPYLVLIDEPTSSLDEISEQSVTGMIQELSQNSLTIVIAHRLKTLELARGLLDTSLLSSQKNIVFMPIDRLIEESAYYRDLIEGKILLESE